MRQVPPGHPHPVARVEVALPGAAERGRGRVAHRDLRCVADPPAGVDDTPGQLDSLVAVPELTGPAPGRVEGAAADERAAFPKPHDVPTAHRVVGAQPRHMTARGSSAIRVDGP